MHYANGREAKVGDRVVGKDACGKPLAGVVVETTIGAERCNLQIVPFSSPTWCATASECLNVEDVFPAKG